jgi:hypothetical protein
MVFSFDENRDLWNSNCFKEGFGSARQIPEYGPGGPLDNAKDGTIIIISRDKVNCGKY